MCVSEERWGGGVDNGFSKEDYRDFHRCPVVKTHASNAGGAGLNPGQGNRIPHAM